MTPPKPHLQLHFVCQACRLSFLSVDAVREFPYARVANDMNIAKSWQIRRLAAQRFPVDCAAESDTVIVAGFGRSGTSWLAELINAANEYRYIFEPLHPRKSAPARTLTGRRYLRPDEDQAHVAEIMDRIMVGRIGGPWCNRFNRKIVARRRLIKVIRANLMLGWIVRRYRQAKLVFLLRHPLAVVASQMKIGWRPRLDGLLDQRHLVEDYFYELEDELRGLNSDFERFVARWCIGQIVPLRQLAREDAQPVFYEDLCQAPEAELDRLSGYLGRDLSAARGRVEVPSKLSRPDSAIRVGRDRLRPWRGILTAADERRAMEILRWFGLDCIYSTDPVPLVGPEELLRLFPSGNVRETAAVGAVQDTRPDAT